ncbi:MAG: hypothetical protein ACJ76Z_06975 [Thermoleophilaceae bacterium]
MTGAETPHDEEWDLFFLLFLVQLARGQEAQGVDAPDWVGVDSLASLVARVGEQGPAVIDKGWAELAEERGLVERRISNGRTELRLTQAARRLFRF